MDKEMPKSFTLFVIGANFKERLQNLIMSKGFILHSKRNNKGATIDLQSVQYYGERKTFLISDTKRENVFCAKVLAMGFEPMRTYVQKILSLPP